MSSCRELLQMCAGRDRAVHVTGAFIEKFGNAAPAALFSGPGRTELGGLRGAGRNDLQSFLLRRRAR